ncbi:hypothetical protein [Sulfuritalea sp.]|uniref:calcium-binding protein n=1 Tax=Sulfuritalea sp. TaxID=2480090 RepID=UPI00286E554E|nr:hypothetical protein [Sulfuritalea sp.]
MPAPTITDYLKFANLQMAAEALYNSDATKGIQLTPGAKYNGTILDRYLTDGNLHASKFIGTEATKFAAQWTVVEHVSNTTTGFSGTLLKAIKDDPANGITKDELVLSFRSTEFIDDAARDNEATNKLEIADKGWAFGQLADMEKWYGELKGAGKITGPLSVTGYSLGGHLATAFNLIHGQEPLENGQPLVKQVINFNGAGVGKIGDGSLFSTRTLLPAMIKHFAKLRADGESTDGLASLFQTAEGRTAYRDLKNALADTYGVPYAGLVDIINNMPSSAVGEPRTGDNLADYDLLWRAMDRALDVHNEAHRAPTLASGSSGGLANPALIGDLYSPATGPQKLAIAAESLDYQLAVLATAKQFNTQPLSLLDGLKATMGKPIMGGGAPLGLGNQWDLTGTEIDAEKQLFMVAHSQYRYGQEFQLFIEDQPLYRGDAISEVLQASFASAAIKLLVPNYSKNDFGDTHSLVLIVDSLNVQNTLLNLVPLTQRGNAAGTLNTLLKEASWRKAESNSGTQGTAQGDVLENVVNALADVVLGPQVKTDRLNGSPDGDTWWRTTEDLSASYSGRDKLYATLDAITASDAYKKVLAGKLTLKPSTDNLASAARKDFEAFAALYSLSPFVLSGPDGLLQSAADSSWSQHPAYVAWKKDKETLADRTKPQTFAITDKWLADRADFLMRKNWFNENNINPLDPSYQYNSTPNAYQNDDVLFLDAASDYKIAQGVVSNATRHFYFGDERNDAFAGRGVVDHLFGGAGDDVLDGQAGDDYLEGNAGTDNLKGGEGHDTLFGGAGADVLEGGAGDDLYIFNTGDGADTIVDTGNNRVLYDGRTISGLVVKNASTGVYEFLDASGNKIEFHSPGVLTLASGTTLTFQNQTSGEMLDGSFGFQLYEEASGPATTRALAGTDQADTLSDNIFEGVYASEVIQGLGGNDSIASFYGGDDRIEGGDGDDWMIGADGNDLVIGGADRDVLIEGAGNDKLYAEGIVTVAAALDAENAAGSGLQGEALSGGFGDDLAIGGAGNDALLGGTGDDILIAGAGDDNIEGDAMAGNIQPDWSVTRTVGTNSYFSTYNQFSMSWPVDGGADAIYAGAGADWVRAGNGNDYVDGGNDADLIWGEAGNDDLFGGAGADLIMGDNASLPISAHGDDYLDGEDGDDSLFGEGGKDRLFGGIGADKLYGQDGGDYLDGEDGNDVLVGGEGADQLFGGVGADFLQGDAGNGVGDGNDYLDGEAGDDILLGLGGSDELHGGDGNDQIAGDNGGTDGSGSADTIHGEAGNDFIDGQGGDDVIDAGADNDIVAGGLGNDQIAGGTGSDQLQGGAGDDQLDGGADADTLFGEAGNDKLLGGAGNDYLIGGLGDDVIDGGDGDDVYFYTRGDGRDRFVDSAGTDWLVFNDLTWGQIRLGVGSLLLTLPDGGEIHLDNFDPDNPYAAGGIDYFQFADGAVMSQGQLIDALGIQPTGTPEADVLSGTALAETIDALAGDDVVTARAGNDTVQAGDGADVVYAGDGNDVVFGGNGDDVLLGEAGDDTLIGDAGNDLLAGGTGTDVLQGGEGDDTYLFQMGDGEDTASDALGQNAIALGAGLTLDAVVFSRQGGDLLVAVKNSTDRLTVKDWFAAGSTFASLSLGDGTLLDHAANAYAWRMAA